MCVSVLELESSPPLCKIFVHINIGLYYLGIKYFIRAGYAEKRSIHKHPPDGPAGINPSETLFSRLQGFVSLTAALSVYVCSCLI